MATRHTVRIVIWPSFFVPGKSPSVAGTMLPLKRERETISTINNPPTSTANDITESKRKMESASYFLKLASNRVRQQLSLEKESFLLLTEIKEKMSLIQDAVGRISIETPKPPEDSPSPTQQDIAPPGDSAPPPEGAAPPDETGIMGEVIDLIAKLLILEEEKGLEE